MLEARAHQQLKALLCREGTQRWPHHLTLSRLVARSLRRGDHTLVRLAPGTHPSWWVSLLVPLALAEVPLALVVSDQLRQRLLQVEWPRLQAAGLLLPCWEGDQAPPHNCLWLLNHKGLLSAWQSGRLGERQLVIPEAEHLEDQLRHAMAVVIEPTHWDILRRSMPRAGASLLDLHERLSRRVMAHPRPPHQLITLTATDEAPLRHLLQVLHPLPHPWPSWLAAGGAGWISWASVDPARLQWQLHRQPIEPLKELANLLEGRGAVLVGELGRAGPATTALGFTPVVDVALGDPPLADPLPVYAPSRQPLPNSPHFADHLLEHCRRLVLGIEGLTVVLIDDSALRLNLASALAGEFGSRVIHQSTAPDGNGVICSGWDWWLEYQSRLPLPAQLIVGLLPIASLEEPLTAARVGRLRFEGRDWFRLWLLPDALNRLQRGLAGLRRNGGRLAVLDGRLRGRGWGRQVFAAIEPWVPLARLLPNENS